MRLEPDKRRRMLGFGLIVMGLGLLVRFFVFGVGVVPIGPLAFLMDLATFGGAVVALIGAAALLGRPKASR